MNEAMGPWIRSSSGPTGGASPSSAAVSSEARISPVPGSTARWRSYGAAARRSTIGAGRKRMETPHVTAERPEQVPRTPAAGQHARRGDRDEPVQLAGGRDRPGPRAAPAEEARAGPGGSAAAAPALARRGDRGRQDDHAHRRRLRGRPRRLLAGALAARPRHRGLRDPPHERRRLPRAPAGPDRAPPYPAPSV